MQASTDIRPNLFLVGAAKCGTTSLYEYLRQHPQIFFPSSSDAKVNWRFKEPAPQARILILLRPPLDQMRSNYNHMMRSDREDIADFHAAVSASDDRRMGRRMPPRGIRAWLDYTGNAKYAPHVQRWLDTLVPRSGR